MPLRKRRIFNDGQQLARASIKEITQVIKELEEEMYAAAKELNFELAATLRDQIKKLRQEVGLEV